MMVKKGTWVRIHDIVLTSAERSPNIPEDTKEVPLEMWTKGFLQGDAVVGDVVKVRTITGRDVKGKLVEANPHYDHDYGRFVPEILEIGLQLKELLWGGDDHE
ncbi:2-amino-4-oxopentanoate thiolase subunit OrtA [Alkaliphilus serpentinus]|uniref:2-amino-4-ketopentanoate thiolase n=1 Tax=Alkaliphilus serpentinus TaxID=1482731 RepID=A0A833M6L5_9FIRM|nr:2-amino-4-oxopentanoate thiolase subunit OrtA [Alkaliphilus serpentinus]KAB3527653.1 2-amino-4-ketopentanoate thiolase [Alkaliphilus serpentinus]